MSLQTNMNNAVIRIATEFKALRTLATGSATGDGSALATTAKNLVGAINELQAQMATNALQSANNLSDVADAAAALANLGGLTQAQVDARVQTIVGAAPAALDTLNELADALGDDPNFAGTVNTALGNRLRVDAAQSFTAAQKTQGRDNLEVYSKAEIGDVTTDLVAIFETNLT